MQVWALGHGIGFRLPKFNRILATASSCGKRHRQFEVF